MKTKKLLFALITVLFTGLVYGQSADGIPAWVMDAAEGKNNSLYEDFKIDPNQYKLISCVIKVFPEDKYDASKGAFIDVFSGIETALVEREENQVVKEVSLPSGYVCDQWGDSNTWIELSYWENKATGEEYLYKMFTKNGEDQNEVIFYQDNVNKIYNHIKNTELGKDLEYVSDYSVFIKSEKNTSSKAKVKKRSVNKIVDHGTSGKTDKEYDFCSYYCVYKIPVSTYSKYNTRNK